MSNSLRDDSIHGKSSPLICETRLFHILRVARR
ncbi:hypothetical protein PIIN_11248 [Serendipita indica DSM 11827]|uniref:Uncharacterized protein n=1 Tax=Serendipita indica (strain DSM 11827) TaxID=1109443 RepID=G4U127_SERID|nr:hypothetical protein PIIN_11248 [Serendipita indica DSM 11827]